MCYKMSFILEGLLLVLVGHKCSGQVTTDFDCGTYAEFASPFEIMCHITGTLATGITWLRPDGTPVVSCSGPDTAGCLPNGPGYTVPHANATVNILRIDETVKEDAGNWTCRDGASGPQGCRIVLKLNPDETSSRISLDPDHEVPENSDLKITVKLNQYYCSHSVSFNVFLNNYAVPLTTIPTNDSVLLNASTEVMVKVTKEMAGSVKLQMGCGHQTPVFVTVQGAKALMICNASATTSSPLCPSTTVTTSSPLSSSSTITSSDGTSTLPPTSIPLSVLLPVVLIPVLVLVLIVGIIIFCCHKWRKQSKCSKQDVAADNNLDRFEKMSM